MTTAQLSLENNQYFTQLHQNIENLALESSHIKSLSAQRKRKYERCLNSFAGYIKKQNEVLKNNIRHSKQRNQYYIKQVKKAWINGISNREIVLKSLARNNVVKNDAEQWICGLGDGMIVGMGNSGVREEVQEGELLRKYQEIVREYQSK